jgi:hypothetical protein
VPSLNTNVTTEGILSMIDYTVTGAGTSSTLKLPSHNIQIIRSTNNTPGYHAKVKAGAVLGAQPFSYIKQITVYPRGTRSRPWAKTLNGWNYSGTFSTSNIIMPTLVPVSNAQQVITNGRAKQSLLSRIKNQKTNFAVAGAEMGKTLSMVASSATKIANSLRNLRHGNIAEAASSLGITASKRSMRRFNRTYRQDAEHAVGKTWLEFQYGWKPLLSDVYGAAQEAADAVSPIFSGTAKAKSSATSVASLSGTENWGFPVNLFLEDRTAKYEVMYIAHYVMQNSVAHRAAMNGLINPLVVAWELVPYSFVVDWFFPIGNYLNTLDATSGLAFTGGSVTSSQTVRSTRTRTLTPNAAGSAENVMMIASLFRVDRTILSVFPEADAPRFQNPVSVGHALNALALLQNFRK